MQLYQPTITGSLLVSGSIVATGGITVSGSIDSASYAATASFVTLSQTASFVTLAQTASFVTTAQTASFVANAQSASNAVTAQTASFANALTVAGTLTAQTLVVQTITSSVDFVTGSTRFGSIIGNTHVFTGSILLTGSIGIGTNPGTSSPPLIHLYNRTEATRLRLEYFSGSAGALDFHSGSVPQWSMVVDTNQTYGKIENRILSSDAIRFYNSNNNVILSPTTGSVGIGTTNPAAKLEVLNGQIRVSGTTAQAIYLIGAATVKPYITINEFGVADWAISAGQSASNTLSITKTLGGTDGVIITSSGHIGIGTTNPSTKLDIAGDLTVGTGETSNTDIVIKNATNAKTHYIFSDSTSGELGIESGASVGIKFNTNGPNTRMVITSGGNVGIGTSSPNSLVSTTNLVVRGITGSTTALVQSLSADTGCSVALYSGASSADDPAILFQKNLRFGSVTDVGLGNFTERIRITSTGNVLIGYNQTTTNTIGRTFATNHASGNRGATLFYGINDGSNGGMFVYNVASSNSSYNSQYITFETHEGGVTAGEVMRISSRGEVGIGVVPKTAASTWRSMQVGNFVLMSPSPATDGNAIIGANVYRSLDNQWKRVIGGPATLIELNQGSGNILTFTAGTSTADSVVSFTSGPYVSNGGVSWTNGSSDVRKKKNFETTQGLAEVLQIEPVKYHFNWDEDNAKKRLGFKAQNLQTLIPEMVVETGELAEDGSNYLTITPDYILPVLVKAIQEQQAQIEELKARLT